MSLKDLSESLGLPRTTTLRLATTFERAGFLKRDPLTDRYTLGPVMLQLGAAASRQYPLHRIVRPEMVWLRNFSQETVNLYIPQDIYRVCIAQEESPQSVRQVIELGRSLPIWLGASGLILLASMNPDKRTDILDRLVAMGNITDYVALTSTLRKVSDQGWALTHGQRELGASSLAVPIYSGTELVAALAISGPTARFTEDRVELFRMPLLERSQDISSQLVFRS